jgi:hypothetical protein
MHIRIRIQIQIQGFVRIVKNLQLKLNDYFFDKILQFRIYLSIKHAQAPGKVFIPQKKTSSTSKLDFSSLLWVILALLDPDSYYQCGSGSGSSRPK